MKTRYASEGIHLFDRATGLNILLDECHIPETKMSAAPANVSIALTNTCNLNCQHCFAPKGEACLDFESLKEWLKELESSGCLGVGFGGGEPLLYRHFYDLINFVHNETDMACTVTTNGTLLTDRTIDVMSQAVDFLRISTNGRSLPNELISRMSDKLKIGVNMLLNRTTILSLEDEAVRYADLGVHEILLLPQISTKVANGVDDDFISDLDLIVRERQWPLRLSISDTVTDAFSCAVRIPGDQGLRQYAHINANGVIKPDSLSETGVEIDSQGVMVALKELETLV